MIIDAAEQTEKVDLSAVQLLTYFTLVLWRFHVGHYFGGHAPHCRHQTDRTQPKVVFISVRHFVFKHATQQKIQLQEISVLPNGRSEYASRSTDCFEMV